MRLSDSSSRMMYSRAFASRIGVWVFPSILKKCTHFRGIHRASQTALTESVTMRMRVNAHGPTTHHISDISYLSMMSTKCRGNVEALSRFFSSNDCSTIDTPSVTMNDMCGRRGLMVRNIDNGNRCFYVFLYLSLARYLAIQYFLFLTFHNWKVTKGSSFPGFTFESDNSSFSKNTKFRYIVFFTKISLIDSKSSSKKEAKNRNLFWN